MYFLFGSYFRFYLFPPIFPVFFSHQAGLSYFFLFSISLHWFHEWKIYTFRMQNTDTKKPRIAVLHDSFLYRGGGERLVTLMAKSLGADLISGFFSEGSFDPRELGFEGKMIALGKPVFAKGIRHLTLAHRFRHGTRILREYDIVIFSGNCLDALRHVRTDAKVHYYCHTPPRYLFDFRERYMEKFPWLIRPIMKMIFDRQAKKYIAALGRFDTIFTNSQNTHDRLLHFCHAESTILYPPTDTERFKIQNSKWEITVPNNLASWILHLESKSYFLSTSRLSPPKRVDVVIEAFRQLPEKNLVFTYGQNDPEKERLLALAAGCKNIFPIPAPKEEIFISLISSAIANIYIPVDEDFGMSPVESMACGVPVIGANEWGLLETVIEWKTGKLIEIQDSKLWIQNLKQVIRNTPKEEWIEMKEDCRERAQAFSLEAFAGNLKKYIYE